MLDLDLSLDLEPPRGKELLRQLATLTEAEGLPFPPVPPQLVEAMRVLGPWQFGTRELAWPLFDLQGWVAEAAAEPVEGYLLFGHDGHGTNSYALHYYLVVAPLALFLQYGFGGAYTESRGERLAASLAAAPHLLQALEAAREGGLVGARERVLVVDGELTTPRWTRHVPGLGEPAWRTADPDPMVAATLWARGHHRGPDDPELCMTRPSGTLWG